MTTGVPWGWPPLSQYLLGFLMQRRDLAPLLGKPAPAAAFGASYNFSASLGLSRMEEYPSGGPDPGLNSLLRGVNWNYYFTCCLKKMASHFLTEVALRLSKIEIGAHRNFQRGGMGPSATISDATERLCLKKGNCDNLPRSKDLSGVTTTLREPH